MMSDNQNEKQRLLVDLIINQDQVTQKWVEFLIAIQAGLVVVLGFLIRPTDTAQTGQAVVPHAGLYIIPVMGILTGCAIAWIVCRERKWTAWYVSRFNALDKLGEQVFPRHGCLGDEKEFDALPSGRTSKVITGLVGFLLLGWIVIIFWVGFFR
jgi:hypothetical protein